MSIPPRLPYPFDKAAAGARVISMSARAAHLFDEMVKALAKQKFFSQAAAKQADVAPKMVKDAMVKGVPLAKPGTRPAAKTPVMHTPVGHGQPVKVAPKTAAKPNALPGEVTKHIDDLRDDIAREVDRAKTKKANVDYWKAVKNKTAYGLALARLEKAQKAYANACGRLVNPTHANSVMAEARRELNAALADLTAAS